MTLQAKTAPGQEAAITIQQQIKDTTNNTDFRPPKQVGREATSIEEVARILNASRRNPEYAARCPAHDDKVESLSFKRGDSVGIVFNCHAGCNFERSIIPALRGLGIDTRGASTTKFAPVIEKIYDYVDESGEVVSQKLRYFPKSFKQRRPDGNGGYVWKLDGVQRVLYNLPAVNSAVKAGEPIYLTEGEKDADALTALGLSATTYIEGASKNKSKWKEIYTEALQGAAKVYIFPDNDEAGKNQAQLILESLTTANISAKIVELPGLVKRGTMSQTG